MGRINVGELQIGVPIPYTAYDENYCLLLREGVTLTNQRQLDALVARGLYRVDNLASPYDGLPPDANPLTRFEQMCRELNSLLAVALPEGEDFSARLLSLAARLDDLCAGHADACLAAVLHDRESRYAVRHMVHVAIVARLLAGLRALSASDRLSLLAAALTMNMSILALQNELNAQGNRSLSPADRLLIRSHPEKSVSLLQARGVTEPTWIAIVAQHHEAYDGRGYPLGLAGATILPAARILALADAYTARLRHRADRHARLPNISLREIFVGGGAFEPALVALLVKTVGIFPPGLIVELENGEIGVVTCRGTLAHAPEVHVVVSAHGNLLRQPERRSTNAAPTRIRHALAADSLRFRFDPLQFWTG